MGERRDRKTERARESQREKDKKVGVGERKK